MRGTSSLLRNVLSNWVVMAISLAYTFTITPLVVRTLGVERYGVWSFLNGLLVYSELLYLGLGSALVKYVAEFRARKDLAGINRLTSVVATIYGLLGLISLGLFAAVSGYVPGIFAEPLGPDTANAAVMTCVLLGVRMLVVFLTSPFAGLLAGYDRYDIGSAVNLVSVIIRFIATPILLQQPWEPLLTMAYLTVGASIVDLVLLAIVAYAGIGGLALRVVTPRWSELRWLYGFGLQSFFIVFAVKLISYADTTIIGVVLGAASVALYSLPLQLVEVARMFIGGFAAVFLPRVTMSSALGDQEGVRGAYLRSMRIAFFLAGWLGAGLITLGPMFLGLWIGPGFGGIPAAVLLYLVLALMGQVLSSQVPLPFYQGLGLLVVPAVVISIEGCVNVALSIWFAKLIGLTGVALATALPAVISVALLPVYLCRKLEVSPRQLFRSLVPGLVMLIGTVTLETLLASMLTSVSWLVLVARIALTVPVGLAVMALLFPENEREMLSRMLRFPRVGFGPLVIVILWCVAAPIAAQDRGLHFTDADIHESDPGARGGAEFLPSGYFTASHQTVRQLIARAYGVRESQVVDVPDPLADARFDIEADAPDAASAVDGPDMLRRLLADRFGLMVRDETRKQPAYALTRDGRKLGRRLHEATARCTPLPGMREDASRQTSNGANECRTAFGWAKDAIFIRQSPMATLVRLLESEVGPVVDRTGLGGKYDVDLFSPGVGPGNPKPASRAPNDPLLEAVREQLGLKLEPTTVDLQVVKVTAIHRP